MRVVVEVSCRLFLSHIHDILVSERVSHLSDAARDNHVVGLRLIKECSAAKLSFRAWDSDRCQLNDVAFIIAEVLIALAGRFSQVDACIVGSVQLIRVNRLNNTVV